jgi:hypothetical protein
LLLVSLDALAPAGLATPTSSGPAAQVDWWDVWQLLLGGVQAVALCRLALDDVHAQVVAAAAEALAAFAGSCPAEELLLEAGLAGAAATGGGRGC